MKLFLKYSVRFILFGLVLFLATRKVNVLTSYMVIARSNLIFILSGLLLYYFKYAIMAMRWETACAAHQKSISRCQLISYQIEIAFLEIMFPLPDSEDGLKLMHMHNRNFSLSQGLAVILYDRMLGVSLLFSILPFSIVVFEQVLTNQGNYHPGLYTSLFLLSFALTVFHRKLLLLGLFLLEKRIKIRGSFLPQLKSELQKKIPVLIVARSAALVLCYAACATLVPWLLVKSMGESVSFVTLVAALPLLYFSAMLPLSVQALGLYETALVFILQLQGINPEIAVAVGFLHFIFHLLLIFTGGVIHIFKSDKTNLEASLTLIAQRVFKSKPE